MFMIAFLSSQHSRPRPRGSEVRRVMTLGTVTLRMIIVALGTVTLGVLAAAHATPSGATGTCESLANLALADATLTSATAVPAGEFAVPGARGGASAPGLTVSGFCRVTATLKSTPESNIKIEVWLPAPERWNGKFLGTGNGGA